MASAANVRAGRAYVEIFLKKSQFEKGLRYAQSEFTSWGKQMQSAANVTAHALLLVGTPLVLLTKQAKEFDDSMRTVGSVLGQIYAKSAVECKRLADITGQSVGAIQSQSSAMNELEKTARRLGATTSFTAKQIADAMVEMARAGLKIAEIQDAVKPIMDLARATGTEIPKSASIAIATMRSFQIEARKMSEVVDILTATANNSPQTLEDLGYAMKYIGPVARSVNVSLKETARDLGLLANFSLKGEQGGAALRNIYMRLADVKNQVKYKEIFGVDVINKETGEFRKLTDIFSDTQRNIKGLGLTTVEVADAFKQIFSMRALAASFSLASADISQMTEALDEASGASDRTSKEMDAGFGGTLRMFISRVQEVGLIIANSIVPQVDQLLTFLIKIIDKGMPLVESFAPVIKVFAGLGTALLGVAAGNAFLAQTSKFIGSIMAQADKLKSRKRFFDFFQQPKVQSQQKIRLDSIDRAQEATRLLSYNLSNSSRTVSSVIIKFNKLYMTFGQVAEKSNRVGRSITELTSTIIESKRSVSGYNTTFNYIKTSFQGVRAQVSLLNKHMLTVSKRLDAVSQKFTSLTKLVDASSSSFTSYYRGILAFSGAFRRFGRWTKEAERSITDLKEKLGTLSTQITTTKSNFASSDKTFETYKGGLVSLAQQIDIVIQKLTALNEFKTVTPKVNETSKETGGKKGKGGKVVVGSSVEGNLKTLMGNITEYDTLAVKFFSISQQISTASVELSKSAISFAKSFGTINRRLNTADTAIANITKAIDPLVRKLTDLAAEISRGMEVTSRSLATPIREIKLNLESLETSYVRLETEAAKAYGVIKGIKADSFARAITKISLSVAEIAIQRNNFVGAIADSGNAFLLATSSAITYADALARIVGSQKAILSSAGQRPKSIATAGSGATGAFGSSNRRSSKSSRGSASNGTSSVANNPSNETGEQFERRVNTQHNTNTGSFGTSVAQLKSSRQALLDENQSGFQSWLNKHKISFTGDPSTDKKIRKAAWKDYQKTDEYRTRMNNVQSLNEQINTREQATSTAATSPLLKERERARILADRAFQKREELKIARNEWKNTHGGSLAGFSASYEGKRLEREYRKAIGGFFASNQAKRSIDRVMREQTPKRSSFTNQAGNDRAQQVNSGRNVVQSRADVDTARARINEYAEESRAKKSVLDVRETAANTKLSEASKKFLSDDSLNDSRKDLRKGFFNFDQRGGNYQRRHDVDYTRTKEGAQAKRQLDDAIRAYRSSRQTRLDTQAIRDQRSAELMALNQEYKNREAAFNLTNTNQSLKFENTIEGQQLIDQQNQKRTEVQQANARRSAQLRTEKRNVRDLLAIRRSYRQGRSDYFNSGEYTSSHQGFSQYQRARESIELAKSDHLAAGAVYKKAADEYKRMHPNAATPFSKTKEGVELEAELRKTATRLRESRTTLKDIASANQELDQIKEERREIKRETARRQETYKNARENLTSAETAKSQADQTASEKKSQAGQFVVDNGRTKGRTFGLNQTQSELVGNRSQSITGLQGASQILNEFEKAAKDKDVRKDMKTIEKSNKSFNRVLRLLPRISQEAVALGNAHMQNRRTLLNAHAEAVREEQRLKSMKDLKTSIDPDKRREYEDQRQRVRDARARVADARNAYNKNLNSLTNDVRNSGLISWREAGKFRQRELSRGDIIQRRRNLINPTNTVYKELNDPNSDIHKRVNRNIKRLYQSGAEIGRSLFETLDRSQKRYDAKLHQEMLNGERSLISRIVQRGRFLATDLTRSLPSSAGNILSVPGKANDRTQRTFVKEFRDNVSPVLRPDFFNERDAAVRERTLARRRYRRQKELVARSSHLATSTDPNDVREYRDLTTRLEAARKEVSGANARVNQAGQNLTKEIEKIERNFKGLQKALGQVQGRLPSIANEHYFAISEKDAILNNPNATQQQRDDAIERAKVAETRFHNLTAIESRLRGQFNAFNPLMRDYISQYGIGRYLDYEDKIDKRKERRREYIDSKNNQQLPNGTESAKKTQNKFLNNLNKTFTSFSKSLGIDVKKLTDRFVSSSKKFVGAIPGVKRAGTAFQLAVQGAGVAMRYASTVIASAKGMFVGMLASMAIGYAITGLIQLAKSITGLGQTAEEVADRIFSRSRSLGAENEARKNKMESAVSTLNRIQELSKKQVLTQKEIDEIETIKMRYESSPSELKDFNDFIKNIKLSRYEGSDGRIKTKLGNEITSQEMNEMSEKFRTAYIDARKREIEVIKNELPEMDKEVLKAKEKVEYWKRYLKFCESTTVTSFGDTINYAVLDVFGVTPEKKQKKADEIIQERINAENKMNEALKEIEEMTKKSNEFVDLVAIKSRNETAFEEFDKLAMQIAEGKTVDNKEFIDSYIGLANSVNAGLKTMSDSLKSAANAIEFSGVKRESEAMLSVARKTLIGALKTSLEEIENPLDPEWLKKLKSETKELKNRLDSYQRVIVSRKTVLNAKYDEQKEEAVAKELDKFNTENKTNFTSDDLFSSTEAVLSHEKELIRYTLTHANEIADSVVEEYNNLPVGAKEYYANAQSIDNKLRTISSIKSLYNSMFGEELPEDLNSNLREILNSYDPIQLFNFYKRIRKSQGRIDERRKIEPDIERAQKEIDNITAQIDKDRTEALEQLQKEHVTGLSKITEQGIDDLSDRFKKTSDSLLTGVARDRRDFEIKTEELNKQFDDYIDSYVHIKLQKAISELENQKVILESQAELDKQRVYFDSTISEEDKTKKIREIDNELKGKLLQVDEEKFKITNGDLAEKEKENAKIEIEGDYKAAIERLKIEFENKIEETQLQFLSGLQKDIKEADISKKKLLNLAEDYYQIVSDEAVKNKKNEFESMQKEIIDSFNKKIDDVNSDGSLSDKERELKINGLSEQFNAEKNAADQEEMRFDYEKLRRETRVKAEGEILSGVKKIESELFFKILDNQAQFFSGIRKDKIEADINKRKISEQKDNYADAVAYLRVEEKKAEFEARIEKIKNSINEKIESVKSDASLTNDERNTKINELDSQLEDSIAKINKELKEFDFEKLRSEVRTTSIQDAERAIRRIENELANKFNEVRMRFASGLTKERAEAENEKQKIEDQREDYVIAAVEMEVSNKNREFDSTRKSIRDRIEEEKEKLSTNESLTEEERASRLEALNEQLKTELSKVDKEQSSFDFNKFKEEISVRSNEELDLAIQKVETELADKITEFQMQLLSGMNKERYEAEVNKRKLEEQRSEYAKLYAEQGEKEKKAEFENRRKEAIKKLNREIERIRKDAALSEEAKVKMISELREQIRKDNERINKEEGLFNYDAHKQRLEKEANAQIDSAKKEIDDNLEEKALESYSLLAQTIQTKKETNEREREKRNKLFDEAIAYFEDDPKKVKRLKRQKELENEDFKKEQEALEKRRRGVSERDFMSEISVNGLEDQNFESEFMNKYEEAAEKIRENFRNLIAEIEEDVTLSDEQKGNKIENAKNRLNTKLKSMERAYELNYNEEIRAKEESVDNLMKGFMNSFALIDPTKINIFDSVQKKYSDLHAEVNKAFLYVMDSIDISDITEREKNKLRKSAETRLEDLKGVLESSQKLALDLEVESMIQTADRFRKFHNKTIKGKTEAKIEESDNAILDSEMSDLRYGLEEDSFRTKTLKQQRKILDYQQTLEDLAANENKIARTKALYENAINSNASFEEKENAQKLYEEALSEKKELKEGLIDKIKEVKEAQESFNKTEGVKGFKNMEVSSTAATTNAYELVGQRYDWQKRVMAQQSTYLEKIAKNTEVDSKMI